MTLVNSLYYSFSAIPQTIAGAIALLGAFVLYKFQIINGEIKSKADIILIEKGVNQNDIVTFNAKKKAFLKYCVSQEWLQDQPHYKEWFKTEAGQITELLEYKRDLRAYFIVSAVLTCVLIAFSILLLMLVGSSKIAWFLFPIGFVLLVLCLASYLYVIFFALADIEDRRDVPFLIIDSCTRAIAFVKKVREFLRKKGRG